jgi:TIR domain
VHNLVAAAIQNCGLQFEVDFTALTIKAKSVVGDFSLFEPGMSIEHNLFQEVIATERVLRKLSPLERGVVNLDRATVRARLRALAESENLQIVLAFGPETVFAPDQNVHELLKDLDVPFYHYGVAEAEASYVATTLAVGHALTGQLRDVLEVLRIDVPPPSAGANTNALPGKPLVFLSYSRHADDARYKEAVEAQLRGLEQLNLIRLFVDVRNISPGQYWNEEIRRNLGEASIAVLLLSQRFMGSDFIMQYEVPALARLMPKERVIPVVVRRCVWNHGPLSALQAPFGALPLEPLSDQDLVSAAADIADHVAKLAQSSS